jgi:mannitol-1-phosphate 5-dehydrogenase
LLVDSSRLLHAPPELPGVGITRRYGARLREKLFVFGAGHHLCAYLGASCHYERVDEAVRDPFLRVLLMESLLEVCSALERADGATSDPWGSITDAVGRYENEQLEDPISRVARSPLRKLAPTGPLVGPAKLVQQTFGRVPPPFALGIASALLYRDPHDAQARQLAAMLPRDGVRNVLRRVSALESRDPVLEAAVVAYERMRWRREPRRPCSARRLASGRSLRAQRVRR